MYIQSIQERSSKASRDSTVGIVSIVIGITFFIVMFIAGVFQLIRLLTGAGTIGSALGTIFLGIGIFIVCLWIGVTNLSLSSRYKKIFSILQGYPINSGRIEIGALVLSTGRNLDVLSKDIYRMLSRGYFPEASIDLNRKELVLVSPEVVASQPLPVQSSHSKTTIYTAKKQFRALPYAVGLCVFLMVLKFFPASFPTIALVIFGIFLAVVTFIVAKKAYPTDVVLSIIPAPKTQEQAVQSDYTNQQQEVFDDAIEHITEMMRIQRTVESQGVKDDIKELITLSNDTLKHVRKHPEKLRTIRQFFNYFLPTTVKLLQSYEEFESKEEKGENITKATEDIKGALKTIVEGFRKEYDNLFLDKAMDISADITVMQNMMGKLQNKNAEENIENINSGDAENSNKTENNSDN